jgi:hypothetical protein
LLLVDAHAGAGLRGTEGFTHRSHLQLQFSYEITKLMWIVNRLARSLTRKLVPPEVEFFASGVAGRRYFMALQPGQPLPSVIEFREAGRKGLGPSTH